MTGPQRQAVTVLLPVALARGFLAAAAAAGRLTGEGAVILDHLLMVKPSAEALARASETGFEGV